ncbi:polynucleotide kinase-phosphatase, partial [Frankia sp. R82]|nr:polynucleotide kinase-phosphatase [Frankia sp. R82]
FPPLGQPPLGPHPRAAPEATGNGARPGGRDGSRSDRERVDLLDVTDVLGRRFLETRHGGRIRIQEENALAALEVMSRFALDPRWLVYLPPTMSPPPTSTLPGLLEHPAEAFAAYRADGVDRLVCEEKHMGSRAVVVLCHDADVAAARFGTAAGLTAGPTGAVYTRTGRPFFPPPLTEQLLTRLRTASERAGLWDELAADWLVFDAEIMPWSAKASDLVARQYAAAGAAARAALPVALGALTAAVGRGIDVADLLGRTSTRLANAEAFTDAYRRYCWPVDGLDGVRIAPFMLLASGSADAPAKRPVAAATYVDRPHAWHLEVAARLADADPTLVAVTRHTTVQVDDADSVAAGVRWWEELTGAGGEGMVVKPADGLVRGERGLVQPGVKVRGREYLRIIYGPDYTEPAHLDRLRSRGLGRKRSLALREYALGLEALERAAAGEPLWRVHECVFAVLALESEPVDPRL